MALATFKAVPAWVQGENGEFMLGRLLWKDNAEGIA